MDTLLFLGLTASLVLGFLLGYYIFIKFPFKMAQSIATHQNVVRRSPRLRFRGRRLMHGKRISGADGFDAETVDEANQSPAWEMPQWEFLQSVRCEIEDLAGSEVYRGHKEQL